ncbi:MAG: CoB--CoM heterodisulfide reductase iron-sulfur subunit B family protein [Chloroflexia bacterium]|nr:CoB--CoM heterodisulfide reductase iron-sulfur subunit B family protein [Chloroflexia bacterium]
MTRYAYYPGCTLEGTAREYDASLRLACQDLQVELEELEGWTCCGASSAHATNHWLSLALPARNLRLAQEQGFEAIVAPCAMCYSRLRHTVHALRDPETRAQVDALLDAPLQEDAKVQVHSLVDLFSQPECLQLLRDKQQRDLGALRLVPYYGCLLVRPPEILEPDDAEHPTMLDRIIESSGATLVDWALKTECCGGSLVLSRTDIALELTRRLLHDAALHDAHGFVVACPMCHANLDMRQGQINRQYDTNYSMPVFYFSQLVGLATGRRVHDLLLDKHLVNPLPLLARLKII